MKNIEAIKYKKPLLKVSQKLRLIEATVCIKKRCLSSFVLTTLMGANNFKRERLNPRFAIMLSMLFKPFLKSIEALRGLIILSLWKAINFDTNIRSFQ